MRFVLSFGIVALFSTTSLAAPWNAVPLANKQSSITQTSRPVQMQRGGSSNNLETLKSLELNTAATGLGYISAMSLGEDGTIFAADKKTGRIWALSDRRQDGTIDVRRPLPHTFSSPTGLAIDGTTLYVADKNAVWVIDAGQDPRQLASLRHAASSGGPHILLSSPDSQNITLGLSKTGHGFHILNLDKQTGQASLDAEENAGHLHTLAQRSGSDIWAASQSSLGVIGNTALTFPKGQYITAMALPGQYETPDNWPAQLKDHIIAAHAGSGAMQLIAIPTEFGQPSGQPRILVDGFLTRTGRSAWGSPGPIIMDKRGLFFADAHNGTLWRLAPKPTPQPKITIVDTADLPPRPQQEPTLTPKDKAMRIESSIQGTQIDATSTIVKPSSIDYGSKLVKDHNEKLAAEEAQKAKAEEETSKKKQTGK